MTRAKLHSRFETQEHSTWNLGFDTLSGKYGPRGLKDRTAIHDIPLVTHYLNPNSVDVDCPLDIRSSDHNLRSYAGGRTG